MPSILDSILEVNSDQLLAPGIDAKTLRNSLGAVLLGSLICCFLTGIVSMQSAMYWRIYPKDMGRIKATVAIVWGVDFVHAFMACAANWTYLIENFGNLDVSTHITWSVAVTVALTALNTFLVQAFFAHRIHTLSRGMWWITAPITILAFLRLFAALVSTAEMIRLRSYPAFVDQFAWVFTVGLSLGAVVDILIAIGLCYFLRRGRTGFSSMDRIIDSITLYTVENGLLTSVTTVISLICWVTMPHNLIFLGLHFAISKLYANSFLATLNARKALMTRSQGSSDRGGDHALPVLFPDSYRSRGVFSRYGAANTGVDPVGTKVQINVEKTIQCDNEGEPSDHATSDLNPTDDEDVAKISRG
ncbi:hypothetical protein CERSUDRAFT_118537 [Gelatoporia subvermispora B]|uniref:DUF6534 domain-containing protein n=1 Tax=Ceriporiopsis subvermispora (strain B) TaxID=914234 RepID=M2R2P4_CERS8|nr:hypothetical protein CERSUDRAFT_118537 [Gelatoporia subvermispora B]